MGSDTKIEWTDATVNFWWGCTKVGPGCDRCYAELTDKRYGGAHWGQGAPRRKIKGAVALMRKLDNGYSDWAADHACAANNAPIFGLPAPTWGSRRRVFVQSMSDLFDLDVPLPWFGEAWQTIEACHWLDVQIVTKRVSAVEKRLAAIGRAAWTVRPGYKGQVGLLITVVNQDEADRDIPRLIALKAKLGIPWVGLSIEPMLGTIVLRPEWLAALDWIIAGGESGPGARPMHPDWARSIRDQCAAAGVPFFFKQWGEWLDVGDWYAGHHRSLVLRAWSGRDWREVRHDDEEYVARIGKRGAGRLLDGRTWDEMPNPRPDAQKARAR